MSFKEKEAAYENRLKSEEKGQETALNELERLNILEARLSKELKKCAGGKVRSKPASLCSQTRENYPILGKNA